MLVAFGGLPGAGKTTIARMVSKALGATYLRIDAIEQAIRSAQVLAGDVGPAGYMAAYALAEANLRLGQTVVADSVNPLAVTREAWRAVAGSACCGIVEVEITCSDAAEHRRRVESRSGDLPGLVPPDWAAVMGRYYEPWPEPHIIIDTAATSCQEAASQLILAVRREMADLAAGSAAS